ncbi:hypothetical protein COMA2_20259 [Candidatus Nitrospira nitrificans]|uniref:Uncharacterized protein n=1 Tax=Candidatus Nitrospira nitrificans TaxID=1742973 RepID=A0A0S4LFK0_9BACT|nr:hypothetical protein COMA2_20259 [Candidatus Nitrospira nitrificans]
MPVHVKPATHDVMPNHAWQAPYTQTHSPVPTHE